MAHPHHTRYAAVMVILLALSGCGSSDDGSSNASAAGVSLTPPAGWQVQENGDRGLVLAQDASDFAAEVPGGPRFTARPAGGEPPDPRRLARSASSGGGATAVSDANRVTIDGHRGVAIAVRERRGGTRVVTGVVAVPLGAGRAYTFLLEAPAGQWDAARGTLNQILYSAKFDVEAVPEA
jgi:hypothetical protein